MYESLFQYDFMGGWHSVFVHIPDHAQQQKQKETDAEKKSAVSMEMYRNGSMKQETLRRFPIISGGSAESSLRSMILPGMTWIWTGFICW